MPNPPARESPRRPGARTSPPKQLAQQRRHNNSKPNILFAAPLCRAGLARRILDEVGGGFPPCLARRVETSSARTSWVRRLSCFSGKAAQRPAVRLMAVQEGVQQTASFIEHLLLALGRRALRRQLLLPVRIDRATTEGDNPPLHCPPCEAARTLDDQNPGTYDPWRIRP